MNKRLFFAVVLLSTGGTLALSRTVLVPRSIATDPTLEHALTYHQEYIHARQDDKFSMSVYAKPLFVHSIYPCELSQYLMPCCRNCCGLSVREDGLGNIGAPWFGVLAEPGTSFNSVLCITPEYAKAGFLFNVRLNLDNLKSGLWLSAALAPVVAYNRLHMHEYQHGNQGSLEWHKTILDALNWYGVQRFCCKVSKGGLDDVQLKLGYTFKPRKHWQLEGYLVGIIPSSNTQKAAYFFEPQVGNGHHGGIGAGFTGVVHLFTHEHSTLDWVTELKYWYLFKHCQCRTFDLCNGDWSRYLAAAFENAPSIGLPMLRMLTKNCTVTPGSQLSLFNTLHWQYKNVQAELGGTFWWRQRERVCLCNNCLCNTGIFDLAGACVGNPVSASHACISQTASGAQAAPSDETFTALTPCNINICSASQPHAYSFQTYAAVGVEAKTWRYPGQLGIGGFYEVANHASALSRAGVWMSMGIRF